MCQSLPTRPSLDTFSQLEKKTARTSPRLKAENGRRSPTKTSSIVFASRGQRHHLRTACGTAAPPAPRLRPPPSPPVRPQADRVVTPSLLLPDPAASARLEWRVFAAPCLTETTPSSRSDRPGDAGVALSLAFGFGAILDPQF